MNTHRLIRSLFYLMLSLGAALPTAIAANRAAWLEATLKKPEKIWLGQRLDLSITLYTRGTFTGTPRFDLPQDAGMIMLPDHGRPLLGSGEVDGVSYLSAQYDIFLFPLRAGSQEVPSFQVEFSYRDENHGTTRIDLATPVLPFKAHPVAGVDPALPLITSSRFHVDDRWQPSLKKAKVGDAFTRLLALSAEGVPGMALPPLKPPQTEGLAIYPEPARVSTDTTRGAFTGKRRQRYVYVFERPGHYRLPAMALQWWNPESEVLKTVRIKGIDIEVAPAPLWQSRAGGGSLFPAGSVSRWILMAVAIGIGGLVLALTLFWWRKNQQGTGRTAEKSEARLFAEFKKTTAGDDAAACMRALMRWLDASGFGGNQATLDAFVRATNSPALADQIEQLQQQLYGRQPASWSGRALYQAVKQARRQHSRQRHRRHAVCENALQALNPP